MTDPDFVERLVRLETSNEIQKEMLEEMLTDVKAIRKEFNRARGFIGGMTLAFTGVFSLFAFGWEYLKTKIGA